MSLAVQSFLSKVGLWVLAMVALAACGEEPVSQAKVAAAADNDVVSRDDAVNVMAVAACHRYGTCRGFGSDPKYPTEDDCRAGEKAHWSQRWNDDNCVEPGHGPVAGKVRDCEARAKSFDCSHNIFDLASEWSECSGSLVCR